MKQVYTAFKFGTYLSNVHDILNVTLDNDMYNESIRGSREIIEDKVQGVEAPYFFYVDDEPLEFEVTFAFENKTKTEIKSLMKTLLARDTYTTLEFGEFSGSTFVEKSPKYNVIFNGEPAISFVGKTSGASYVYDGYFSLNARCDRPYGYKTVSSFTVTHAGMNHASDADISVYPNISITASGSSFTNVILKSWQNSNYTGSILSQIGFTSIGNGETLTISGNLFTITSNSAQSTVYSRWDRNNFKIFSGNNYLTVEKTGAGTLTVSIQYEAPIFIKD